MIPSVSRFKMFGWNLYYHVIRWYNRALKFDQEYISKIDREPP